MSKLWEVLQYTPQGSARWHVDDLSPGDRIIVEGEPVALCVEDGGVGKWVVDINTGQPWPTTDCIGHLQRVGFYRLDLCHKDLADKLVEDMDGVLWWVCYAHNLYTEDNDPLVAVEVGGKGMGKWTSKEMYGRVLVEDRKVVLR